MYVWYVSVPLVVVFHVCGRGYACKYVCVCVCMHFSIRELTVHLQFLKL